ncbi:MAG: acyl-CoA thioesterase [Pseudomonadota bacterium]|nr:acyl-CoA thioesterase [Pseudomonadota bacterium]
MSGGFPARHRLRLAHCDAAGIAYYPRLLELADGVIEDWTEQVMEIARRALHLDMGRGLPTVDMKARFTNPSRLGDWLDFTLRVERIGTSSIDFALEMTCAGQSRLSIQYTQVLVELAVMRSLPWPADWRARIEETMR